MKHTPGGFTRRVTPRERFDYAESAYRQRVTVACLTSDEPRKAPEYNWWDAVWRERMAQYRDGPEPF